MVKTIDLCVLNKNTVTFLLQYADGGKLSHSF